MRRCERRGGMLGGLAALVVGALGLSCSGGGGGDGGVSPPPVNDTPASITLSPTGPLSLASGANTSISATVRNSAGGVVSATVTWTSSDPTVAQVSSGVVSGVRVGTTTISASAGAVTSSGVAVTVIPGAAATLVLRMQPGGAVVGVPLVTQPVIELRDAAGNVAESSSTSITASITTGGGTVSGGTASTVAGVATFNGLTLIGIAGQRTLTFSASGLPSVTSSTFALAVGAPSALRVKTEPTGAAVAQAFATQPEVEVRDAGGNVVSAVASVVVATLSSGGGTLSGTTAATTVAGVAKFTDLALVGLIGPRTLSFAATGLAPITSASFTLTPGAPAVISVATQPVGGAIGAPLITPPVVEIRDVAGNLATTATTTVTASVSFGGGSVLAGGTATTANGVATFNNLSLSGSAGDRELTFGIVGLPSVASARFTLAMIVYGVAGQKIQFLDAGGTATPTSSAGTPPVFVSRAATRATVDNGGKISALAEGQSWVVSSITGGSDSVLTIVTRAAGGPILRTNLTTYRVPASVPTTVDLVLDPRSTAVGAMSLFVAPVLEAGPVTASVVALQPSGAQVTVNSPSTGIYRYVIASAVGVSSPVTFGRIQFTAGVPGTVVTINVTAIDAFAPNGSEILSRTTSTYYLVISQ